LITLVSIGIKPSRKTPYHIVTPVNYTYFPNTFFAILNTSLAFMFISYRHKFTVTQFREPEVIYRCIPFKMLQLKYVYIDEGYILYSVTIFVL